MRHWNYRIIEFIDDTNGEYTPWFAIHEVHYENDKPIYYSENPAVIIGDNREELICIFDKFKEALTKSILVDKDFSSEVAKD